MILWEAVSVNATSEGPLRVGLRVPRNRVTASFLRIVIDLVKLWIVYSLLLRQEAAVSGGV